VIIPTYNCADYIGDALRSVAIQAVQDLEIIVVDDCSSDLTQFVVTRSELPCRFFVNDRNLGPAGTRNHGILQSKGHYLAFLDADDAWLPGKLTAQLQVLDSDPGLLAVGGQMIPWACDPPAASSAGSVSAIKQYSFDEMVVRNRLATPTVVCRRDALAKVGLFDESMNISEDYELWLRLCSIGRVGRIDVPLARFRQRADGASAGDRDRAHRLDQLFVQSIPARYPDVPGIGRTVKKGLSARSLDRAIELCDVERRYLDSLWATVDSCWKWPWFNPINPNKHLTRLRRLRRIFLNAISFSHRRVTS
jgi:glycosyltransferase involved in cell wall biosynthesis